MRLATLRRKQRNARVPAMSALAQHFPLRNPMSKSILEISTRHGNVVSSRSWLVMGSLVQPFVQLYIVQGYVLRDCGCDDAYGSPPLQQPYIDFGSICNICGGEGGSDLVQVTKPEAFMDTGVGISTKCQFLY